MVWGKEVPTTVGLSLGAAMGGTPKMVSASLGRRTLADELSPFTGARTPPLPGFEASCPGGFPPCSRMTQRPQLRKDPRLTCNDSIAGIVAVYSAGELLNPRITAVAYSAQRRSRLQQGVCARIKAP